MLNLCLQVFQHKLIYVQGVDYRISMLCFSMLKFLKVGLCYLKQASLIRNLLNETSFLFVSLT